MRVTRTIPFCLLAAVFLLPACATTGPAKKARPAEVITYDARTLYETVRMWGSSFSHDETRILVTSDATGVLNAHSIPVQGGQATPITQSKKESAFGVSFFPKDDRILYLADQGGNELYHLFVRELDGSVKDLTPGEKTKASFKGWSKDKAHFWVSTNERDPKFFDLYRYATDGYQRELAFENKDGWMVGDPSPDGRWVPLEKIHSNVNDDLYVWDTTKPKEAPKLATPHEGDATHNVLAITPDSQAMIYSTNQHGEFRQAWSYDLESGERKVVVEADWDVSFVWFSEEGRYRVTGVNEDARTKVTVLDTRTGKQVAFPELPAADISGVDFSPSERKMVFYASDDTSPANLHVVDLKSGEHSRLSDNKNPKVDSSKLVQGKVVRYKSFDGLEIPALLLQPKGASADKPVPALVWVHGGPGGQSRHGYSPLLQFLVNHGYAVLAVNNRGSSGYGKTFYHMDDRKHGDVDLKDCVWARRHLESLGWVDKKRIGIIGGSYGGYMVAAALAFEPDAFDVGIDIFGVTNWLRTLNSIPDWWEAFKKYLYAEMGDPATDEERLKKISPLFHAEKIRKPLLVIQGANDPRVLRAESDEIVAAVKKNGVPVEYVVFDDEGHGFRKRENRIKAAEAYLKFLDQHLLGK